MPDHSEPRALFVAFLAVLFWSTSAVLLVGTGDMPPFLVAGSTSLIGFLLFAVVWRKRHLPVRVLVRMPAATWLLGLAAYGLYRIAIIYGIKHAPPFEANLINYLWPALILVFVTLINREKLDRRNLIFLLCGLSGTVLLFVYKGMSELSQFGLGHLAALAAALTWALYSVLAKKMMPPSTYAVGIFFFVCGVFFMTAHMLFEPHDAYEPLRWGYLVLFGLLSSMGYILWDWAIKHGPIQKIGTLSYLTPLLSSFWLLAFTPVNMSPLLAVAAALIVGPNAANFLIALRKPRRARRATMMHPD